jgi:hypothetical protein
LQLHIEKGLISFSPVTKYSNGVTKYSNAETPSSSSNSEICTQMESLERDLIPRPFPYQGNALPGLATKAKRKMYTDLNIVTLNLAGII